MKEVVLWSAINISEGRDLESLTDLALRLERSRVCLADWSADFDHNRSVFSLVGTVETLALGIEEIFSWAQSHITLHTHSGVHPRLGAVDVIPFVPLSAGSSLEEAKKAALEIAPQIAEKFNIPTFLYRDSSSTPSPLTLPELRRGGLQRLQERMALGELRPDFGPAVAHASLGVSVFGARPPLTAFNCLLNTDQLDLGRAIAKEIRGSNGGVPHLQSLAFQLGSQQNRVQVSMNILNPQETPPHIAYLAVKQACQKRGLEIVKSELIGLVTLESLQRAFQHFLQLESFRPGQVAEWNLLHHKLERTQHI